MRGHTHTRTVITSVVWTKSLIYGDMRDSGLGGGVQQPHTCRSSGICCCCLRYSSKNRKHKSYLWPSSKYTEYFFSFFLKPPHTHGEQCDKISDAPGSFFFFSSLLWQRQQLLLSWHAKFIHMYPWCFWLFTGRKIKIHSPSCCCSSRPPPLFDFLF